MNYCCPSLRFWSTKSISIRVGQPSPTGATIQPRLPSYQAVHRFCRPWRGGHHGPADVKAWMALNFVITQRGSAAGFHANDRQGCYTCELRCQRQQQAGTFTAWLSQKAAALIQTNTFGCSFGSRRPNWPPVCASSWVFYCSFTTEISPLWGQIKVFLIHIRILQIPQVSGYRAAPRRAAPSVR